MASSDQDHAEERLEDVFQDEIIKAFADITSFKQFARSENGLCLDQSYIKIIVKDHKCTVEEIKLCMLSKWREINGDKATVLNIRNLLHKYFRREYSSGYLVLENGIFGVYKNRFLCKRSNVYLGEQISEISGTQTRAIKVVPKNRKNLREAKILMKIGNHVNVVSILHAGIYYAEPYDYIYIVMEHSWTQTVRNMLGEWIKLGKSFHEFIAWSLAEQLMRAVEFLHSLNIIHRDVKPDNVLASDDWKHFKLTDYELSKEVQDGYATIQTDATTGTEGYRSRETYDITAKITAKVDTFSAGITIAEIMAKGKHPFGEDPDLWRYYIKNNKNLDLSHIHVFNNDQVIGLIEQMLEMDPEKRPTAEIVLNDVSLYVQMFQLNQKTTAGRSLAATSKEGRIVDVFQDEIIRQLPFREFIKFARSSDGLGLEELHLQNIAEKHENNDAEQQMQMLFQWKTNNANEASVPKIRSLLQSYCDREKNIQEGHLVDAFRKEIIRAFSDFAGFKKFARSKYGLCLNERDLENIAVKHEKDLEEQKLQMLFQWKANNGNSASTSKIRSCLQSYRDQQKVIQEGRIVDVFQDEIVTAFSDIAGFMKFARSSNGLCLEEPPLQNIAEKHEHNVEEQKMKILFQWKTDNGNEASISDIRSLLQSYSDREIQKAETRRRQSTLRKRKLETPAEEGNSASPQKSSGFGDDAGTSNSNAREATVNRPTVVCNKYTVINTVVNNEECTESTTCVADAEIKSGGTHNY